MRLYEFITEDVSATESLKHINDILVVQLPQLYHRLTIMAEKMYHNKGNLEGLRLVAGGQKSQWFNDVFFNSLKPALYSFAKSLPGPHRKQLTDLAGTKSFSTVSSIVNLLGEIARKTGNKSLLQSTAAAINAENKFDKRLSELDVNDGNDDSGYVDEPAPNNNAAIGQQNAEVNNIIRDILSRIDQRHAGEIRNEIARSDNKLQALMAALRRRGLEA